MKRVLVAALIAIAASSCVGAPKERSAPTPAPTVSYRPGEAPAYQNNKYPLLGPAGRARQTADDAENYQNRVEQQTGGGSENVYP